MEPFSSSLDGHPTAAARRKSQSRLQSQSQLQSHLHGGEQEDVESPGDTLSGQESGNDGQSGGGLKRKRPITVSYVSAIYIDTSR